MVLTYLSSIAIDYQIDTTGGLPKEYLQNGIPGNLPVFTS
jgi:hypothetical protein